MSAINVYFLHHTVEARTKCRKSYLHSWILDLAFGQLEAPCVCFALQLAPTCCVGHLAVNDLYT